MGKFIPSEQDEKEINALLIFLSGITKTSPIKSFKFERAKKQNKLTIERYNDGNRKKFTTIEVKQKNN